MSVSAAHMAMGEVGVSPGGPLIQPHFQLPNPRPLPRACCAHRAQPVGPFWLLEVTLYQAKQGQMRKARTGLSRADLPSVQCTCPVRSGSSELSNTSKSSCSMGAGWSG